jgi:hypothetical protein
MEIKYDNKGRILACSVLAGKENGKVLKISESKLPRDFLATFALGKYLVKNKKIVANKDSIQIDLMQIFNVRFPHEVFLQTMKKV